MDFCKSKENILDLKFLEAGFRNILNFSVLTLHKGGKGPVKKNGFLCLKSVLVLFPVPC